MLDMHLRLFAIVNLFLEKYNKPEELEAKQATCKVNLCSWED